MGGALEAYGSRCVCACVCVCVCVCVYVYVFRTSFSATAKSAKTAMQVLCDNIFQVLFCKF